MRQALLTLTWLVGCIYATIPLFALLLHAFRKFLRARHSALQVVIPSWFAMMAIVYLTTARWREVVFYQARTAWLGAAPLFAIAILIYSRSRLRLPRTRLGLPRCPSALPGDSQGRQLITNGIRQRIRHPIYLAHFCMLMGWTVGSGEVVLYGFTIFALVTGWPMIRQEEADLERRFGEEYATYKRAVPAAFVPRLYRSAKSSAEKESFG